MVSMVYKKAKKLFKRLVAAMILFSKHSYCRTAEFRTKNKKKNLDCRYWNGKFFAEVALSILTADWHYIWFYITFGKHGMKNRKNRNCHDHSSKLCLFFLIRMVLFILNLWTRTNSELTWSFVILKCWQGYAILFIKGTFTMMMY